MKEPHTKGVLSFCQIQLAILAEREDNLRKEILDCKIQKEFLTHTIAALSSANNSEKNPS